MANIERVLARLDKVKKSGKGWIACCPAHEDRSPSMVVSEIDGKIIFNCFAGCTFSEICGALGMEEKDMFPEPVTKFQHTSGVTYLTQKQLEEIDLQCWFCAVFYSDLQARKPINSQDINTFQRCVLNLRKQLGHLIDLGHDDLAVRVFKVLFLVSQNNKKAIS